MNKNTTIFIIGIIVVAAILIVPKLGLFVITGQETVTRTAPTTVNPSSTFTVTYTANQVSGAWGTSIVDSITGGCTVNGKSSLQFVMLSDLPNPMTYTVQAPASGTCIFHGDYQFGNFPIGTMSDTTVLICNSACIRPSDLCLATSSNGCGGTCNWIVTRNSMAPDADTNCDRLISRTELGDYINKWIAGTATRNALGNAIMAWVTGGT